MSALQRRTEKLGDGTESRVEWALVGPHGAVTLLGLLLPSWLRSDNVDEASSLLGFVRTDAGWLMPADLGVHRPPEDYQPGMVRMEECPWLGEGGCWYEGSGLAAWGPLAEWELRGFDDAVLETVLRAFYAESFDASWEPA